MRSVKLVGWLVGAMAVSMAMVMGCGGDDDESTPAAGGAAGQAGEAGAAGGGQGGTAGGGQGGTAGGGQGGTAGGGQGGTAGGGQGGSAGGGQGGSAGGTPGVCNTPDPGSVSNVESCGSLGNSPANGTCTVTAGTNAYTAYRGVVLGPDTVYEGGEVLVDGNGIIACVGCSCSSDSNYAAARKVTCPEGVISPGLINAHDHTTFANNRPYGTANYASVKDVRYDHRHQWRKGQDGKPAIPTKSGASAATQTAAELRFMMSGATAINGSNGAAGMLRNLDKDAKLEGLTMPALQYETFPLGDSSGQTLTSGCNYSGPTSSSQAQGYSFFTPHVSEGINAAARNEFVCQSTGQYDLLFTTSGWIHGIGLIADDVKLFSRENTKLIWSPRTNVSLYGDTARVPLYHKAGAIIALGTDWVASGSMNMSRELQCARELNETRFDNYFTDEDLWRMATTNGAFATGFQKGLGMLKKGYAADVAVFNGKTNKKHTAVVKAELADTVLVLRGGAPMYGDSQLMSDLGKGSCEDMPTAADASSNAAWATGVCGVAKKACVDSDPNVADGVTVASAAAAIGADYPLYFCGTPNMEPSCVPMRPGQYPAASDDKDGDGVADASDNCPDMFNPIRPIDESKQRDFDGDNIGDECDACPFDADNNACTYNWSANDVDCDGIKNGTDNCPTVGNGDQADDDSDGKGNACDSCPTEANPGPIACTSKPTTIDVIRKSGVNNDPVVIGEAIVTGVRKQSTSSNGFYLTDVTTGPWHCIYVHTGSTMPTVKAGDHVKIEGKYSIYYDLSEIVDATVTVLSSGTAPVELDLTVAEMIGADAESYESCRVRVQNVTGVAEGTGVAVEQSGSKVNVSNYIWAGTNFVTVGTSYKEVKGFGNYFKNAREILPQTDADVVVQ